ncbi:hypothetical protein LTR82_015569 [Friedmanniomyces endolithicus]|uniref:Uncharacterized protein n=1 Tax=Friedmanniomyces endolithicus TaxID=329885 RepID=A0AAN6J1Y5_9PEZI|nr:hypothetical protein LTR82_015569 [Friedmanniomyces endolithicus]
MPSLTVFMKNFLSKDDAKPGRLVTNLDNPAYQYCTKEVLQLTDADVSKRAYHNVEALTKAHASNSFQAALTKLLRVFASQSSDSVERIQTRKAYSYDLRNVPDKLEQLVADGDVKLWLEKVNQRMTIYMIVAVHTVESATVGQDAQSSVRAGAAATVPLAEAAAPGASATPVGEALDVSVEVEHEHDDETRFSSVAPSERIIAVSYQKVLLKTFLGDPKTPAMDTKTVWKSFSASREGTAGVQMVEASIGNTSTGDLPNKFAIEAESSSGETVFVIIAV